MKMIPIAILYFTAVIILAHFFTPPEYNWMRNTVSDLSAQGVKNQWIMQAGFIGFGILLNLGFIQKWSAAGKLTYSDMLIMLYGASVLLSGIFSTSPYLENVPYSIQQSNLHSLFAQVAGISFSIAIFMRLVTAPPHAEKWLHLVFFILVIGTSLLFGLSENGILPIARGIIQRSLYLVSFLWLFLLK